MQQLNERPRELGSDYWAREGGAAAKVRPTTIADALAALDKAVSAIDLRALDASLVEDLIDLPAALRTAENEAERRVKPARAAAQAVTSAVSKWAAVVNRRDPALKDALAASAVIARAAESFGSGLDRFVESALAAFEARRKALEDAIANAPPPPERVRIKGRVVDKFRLVKMRPDQKVCYLLCVGHRSAAAWLAPSVNDSMKPFLVKALKGDTGFKFYRGEVVWENSLYTFVGARMTKTLARRIENGLMEIIGTRYRIGAREGQAARAAAPAGGA